MGIRGELFSSKASVNRRTYFFNVKENRQGSMFLNMVESRNKGEEGFERQSIVVYEEDLDLFEREMEKALAFIRQRKRS